MATTMTDDDAVLARLAAEVTSIFNGVKYMTLTLASLGMPERDAINYALSVYATPFGWTCSYIGDEVRVGWSVRCDVYNASMYLTTHLGVKVMKCTYESPSQQFECEFGEFGGTDRWVTVDPKTQHGQRGRFQDRQGGNAFVQTFRRLMMPHGILI